MSDAVCCTGVVQLRKSHGGVLMLLCLVRTTTQAMVRSWSFRSWTSLTRASTSAWPGTRCQELRPGVTSHSLLNVSDILAWILYKCGAVCGGRSQG